MFIEFLTQQSFSVTMAKKRKAISKQDVDVAIAKPDTLYFLEDGLMDMDSQTIVRGTFDPTPQTK